MTNSNTALDLSVSVIATTPNLIALTEALNENRCKEEHLLMLRLGFVYRHAYDDTFMLSYSHVPDLNLVYSGVESELILAPHRAISYLICKRHCPDIPRWERILDCSIARIYNLETIEYVAAKLQQGALMEDFFDTKSF